MCPSQAPLFDCIQTSLWYELTIDSASEVTTLWRYTNLFIIIIVVVFMMINAKNCSLSILLTATDQKPQKSIKRWYYTPSHRLIGTTHDDHLVVSVVVQNLVEIDAVISVIWNFQCFCTFGLKTPIHAPKIGVWGYFTPKMGSNINEIPKRHILARVRVVWAIKHENPSTGLTCRWVPEKKV